MVVTQDRLSASHSGAALSRLRHGDVDLAWEDSEAGIQAVGKDRSLTEYWSLEFIRIQILSLRGQVSEALGHLNLLGNPSSEDVESLISLNMHRGYLLALSGRYDCSQAFLSRAEALASESGLTELEGEVLVRHAAVACLEHNFDTAQKLYRTLADDSGKKYGKFLYCVGLAGVGKTCLALKQSSDALSWHGAALAIATSEGFGLLLPSILGDMGASQLERGDFKESLELHFQAERLLLKSGARRSHPVNLYDIGNVYFRMGEYGTAIAYYHRALVLAKEMELAVCIERCTVHMRLAYAVLANSIRESACHRESPYLESAG